MTAPVDRMVVEILPDFSLFVVRLREGIAASMKGMQTQIDTANRGFAKSIESTAAATSTAVRVESDGMAASVGRGMRRATGAITGMLRGVRDAAMSLMKVFVPLVVAFGAFEALKGAIKFQKAMTLVQTQAGASAAEIRKMGPALLALAGPLGTSPEQLALSLYHVESIGIRGAAALDLVKTAAKGAKIGNASLEETTNALTAVIASGIVKGNDFASAMQFINQTVGSGDMKLSDFNSTMSNGLLAVLHQLGVPLKDVGASLAVLGDNNIRGANASTMLRMAVQAMAVPIRGGAKALSDIGIKSGQLGKDLQTGGVPKALQDIHDHLVKAGISGKQTGEFLLNAFGKRAGTGVSVLLDQLGRLKQKEADQAGGAKKFGDAWKATTKNLSFEIDQAKAWFTALGIRIGTALIPVIQKVIGWVEKHWKGFQTLGNVIKSVAVGIYQHILLPVWHDVVRAIVNISDWVHRHQAGLQTLADKLKALATGAYTKVLLPAVHGVQRAIQGIIGWIDKHHEQLIKLGRQVSGVATDAYNKLLKPALHDIANFFRNASDFVHRHHVVLGKLAGYIGGTVIVIFKSWISYLHGVIDVLHAVGTGIGWLWTFAQKAWRNVGAPVFEAIKSANSAFVSQFTSVWDAVASIVSSTWSGLQKIWHAIDVEGIQPLERVLQGFSDQWHSLWSAIGTAVSDVWGYIEPVLSQIGGALNGVLGAVGKLDKLAGHIPGLSSVLSSFGLAEGGLVTGAGGPKSDSQLRRVSPGEFVVNAAATSANLGLLTSLNNRSAPKVSIPGAGVGAPSSYVSAGSAGGGDLAAVVAKAVGRELRGLEFSFDGDGIARIVAKRQAVQNVKGVRR